MGCHCMEEKVDTAVEVAETMVVGSEETWEVWSEVMP